MFDFRQHPLEHYAEYLTPDVTTRQEQRVDDVHRQPTDGPKDGSQQAHQLAAQGENSGGC